jgi:hypothetical protein
MSDDRPITPEQALLAVKAAGLDPDKSLSEQLNEPAQLDEQTVKGWVGEAVAEAIDAQSQGAAPTDAQTQERQFAESYRDALNKSLTPWMGEDPDAA